jgi:hypothetical protein
MTIFEISPLIPDLHVPRAYPCGAIVAPPAFHCGATPASLYLRVCGVAGHEQKVWLCPIHATMATHGAALCRECAKRGGITPVVLYRLTEPLRFV